MICQNCGAHLSCSCKKRTASDGKDCCQNCITQYETGLTLIKNNTQK